MSVFCDGDGDGDGDQAAVMVIQVLAWLKILKEKDDLKQLVGGFSLLAT